MHFLRILLNIFTQLLVISVSINAYAQSIPNAPSLIDFAGVSIQLNQPAQLRLQQSLNKLYTDRTLLLGHLETLNQLRPILDPRLAANNIPADFRYVCLPFTEPNADPYAYWGLDNQRASQLGIMVNQTVDCRRNVVLATDAVLPYFNQLHQQNGHWLRTLLQYFDASQTVITVEHGLAHWVLDARSPAVIWTILARKIAYEREQALLRSGSAFILVEYWGANDKTLVEVASLLNLNTSRLSPYNNWILAGRIPLAGKFPVILRLPPEEYLAVKPRLVADIGKVIPPSKATVTTDDLGFPILRRLAPVPAEPSAIFYKINDKRGVQAQLCDNAITLAYYGKVPVSKFLTINDLTAHEVLKPGDVYYLQRKSKRAKVPFHVVQQGQTLRDVSAMYGVRLQSLLRYNRLESSRFVSAGRVIWIQQKRPSDHPIEYKPIPPAKIEKSEKSTVPVTISRIPSISVSLDSARIELDPAELALSDSLAMNDSLTIKSVDSILAQPHAVIKMHVVKAGQTYFSVAKLYGITINQLCNWNNLSVRQPLYAGQELIINSLGANALTAKQKQQVAAQAPPVKKPAEPVASAKEDIEYHTVKPGETVYRLTQNYAISKEELMRLNGLKDFTIHVGQRLIVKNKNQ